MAKKKNLTKQDIEDVSTYDTYSALKTNGHNGISINDIPIKIKCLNEKQKHLKISIEEKEITISIGPAGTGKTYLSLLTALHLLKTEPRFRKIVLVKSLTTIKGEEVGFLPGTLWEKLEPFMYSFTGNLDKIFNSRTMAKNLMDKGIIEVMPIAYIRGVTIDNAIVIIDETQNMDLHTFKTIITRIGYNSKMIFLGDIEQIDRKDKKESCLDKVVNLFRDKDFVGTVEFIDEDCVRNPIIPKVLKVLDEIN
jgi:phosphate starvation-inducible protein PhoH and related proteins